eukprot:CAMPEP_0197464550 /NCGR_PEP_ID=MMETSP1175-20131217/64076_1 /TAXON_ID=1003142 /ORGANISM="Triceratium dubium, Strain CCMP147" /LENGTH=648 /DNA_ID=CAMNT_0043000531 /DNA_START=255 /DNA_END=2201 /DNA_ORIENTATION=+
MADNEEFNNDHIDSKEVHSRKERLTGSTHFGDKDFHDESPEEIGDATWGEVCRACCVHTPKEWGIIFVGLCVLCFFLYFFLLGLELLGSSAKVLGGCSAGTILGNETNPIAALMIGVLATVLLQSSSTTTSIIVGLVGGGAIPTQQAIYMIMGANTTSIIVGLVGGGAIPTQQAIYMIMGANIGTSVTNTIVAMGHLGNGDELERAFAGATVHDAFNYLSVVILLPVEAATGMLYKMTKAMLPDEAFEKGNSWEGPIKQIVSPLGNRIIKANKKIISAIADPDSDKTCDDFYPVNNRIIKANKKIISAIADPDSDKTCDDFYPVNCTDGIEDYEHCKGKWGLIECDKKTGLCPAFFQNGATQSDDYVSGGVCLFLAIVILIICLIGLVTLLQRMLLGTSTRIIYKATNINGYLAMLLGCGITILVQSSSITTSTLTPLVGMGVIHIEQMYPLTLGANIGTTFTALMAAMVSDKIDALQTALAHLFFNIFGILIWYPIPFMRRVPIAIARRLGKCTRIWRLFPVVYIVVMFFVVPGLLLGLSACFEKGSKGLTVLGSFLVILIVFGIGYAFYWWRFKDGKEKCISCLKARQRQNDAKKALPDDMDYLKAEISRLREHTGLLDEEEEGKDVENAKSVDTSEDDMEEEEEA